MQRGLTLKYDMFVEDWQNFIEANPHIQNCQIIGKKGQAKLYTFILGALSPFLEELLTSLPPYIDGCIILPDIEWEDISRFIESLSKYGQTFRISKELAETLRINWDLTTNAGEGIDIINYFNYFHDTNIEQEGDKEIADATNEEMYDPIVDGQDEMRNDITENMNSVMEIMYDKENGNGENKSDTFTETIENKTMNEKNSPGKDEFQKIFKKGQNPECIQSNKNMRKKRKIKTIYPSIQNDGSNKQPKLEGNHSGFNNSNTSKDCFENEDLRAKITTPDIPTFSLSAQSMYKFFTDFLRDLYRIEDKQKVRLYAKCDEDGRNEEATPLDIWDESCEKIFPRNLYFGVGRRYIPGNLLWRQKCLVAYILQKLNIDYNSFAESIPQNYITKSWSGEDFVSLSKRREHDVVVEETEFINNAIEKENNAKKVKLTRPDMPTFALDCVLMGRYFNIFLRDLYVNEGKHKFRLYAKASDGKLVEEATPLDIWDEICEEIFPRNQYFGSGRRYQPGNCLWRQKCLVAYVLDKLNIDYNTFAKLVPHDYKIKSWSGKDFVSLSRKSENDFDKCE